MVGKIKRCDVVVSIQADGTGRKLDLDDGIKAAVGKYKTFAQNVPGVNTLCEDPSPRGVSAARTLPCH